MPEVPAGLLRLRAGVVAGRTRLLEARFEPPLQVLRARHLDQRLPDLAFVSLLSPGGGILQGDRLTMSVDVEAGARLHVDTTSATRLYRMPAAAARLDTRVRLGDGAYLEYVPEPYLPYRGSRFSQSARYEVAENAVLVLGEVVGPGRAARGEVLAFDSFLSTVEAVRLGESESLFRDALRLEPGAELAAPGALGCHRACGSLYVVASGFSPDVLAEAVSPFERGTAYAGCSELPAAAGAWLRVLAADVPTAAAVVRAAWRAARLALLGADLPPLRRY